MHQSSWEVKPAILLPPSTSLQGRHKHKASQFLHMPGVTQERVLTSAQMGWPEEPAARLKVAT